MARCGLFWFSVSTLLQCVKAECTLMQREYIWKKKLNRTHHHKTKSGTYPSAARGLGFQWHIRNLTSLCMRHSDLAKMRPWDCIGKSLTQIFHPLPYGFPSAAVTNYHWLAALQRQQFVLSQSGVRKSAVQLLAVMLPPWALGENSPCLFQLLVLGHPQCSLANMLLHQSTFCLCLHMAVFSFWESLCLWSLIKVLVTG
jgi:hypothetical protein